jgi:hypothetical protein
METLDDSVEGTPYAHLAKEYEEGEIQGRFRSYGFPRVPAERTASGPFQYTDSATRSIACFLFFISIQVCEDKKGDCALWLEETREQYDYDPATGGWTKTGEVMTPHTPKGYRPAVDSAGWYIEFPENVEGAGEHTIVIADIPYANVELTRRLWKNKVTQKWTIRDPEVTFSHTVTIGHDGKHLVAEPE